MDFIMFSLLLLGLAMFGMYALGKKELYMHDGGKSVLLIFIFGAFTMAYGGYGLGIGHPVKASGILNKGEVYSVEAEKNKHNKIFATVTDKDENVYAVVFDKPPPPKFKVFEDKDGQVYIAVP